MRSGLWAAALAALIIVAVPAMAADDVAEEQAADIIVTGERVARQQTDVLSSVTVVTGAEVARSGERGVYETIVGAPNITPAPGEFLPPIRGDETGGPGGLFGGVLFGTQPRATLIVDDVQRISSGANNSATSIFDVAQVEILRGPQTTLRGANAISGAYLILTNRPVPTFEASALGELVDNNIVDPTYRLAGMFNVPVTGGVAARFTAERIDGYVPIRVRPADPTAPVPPGVDFEELSAFDKNRFRGQLLVDPVALPDFQLLLQGEYEDGVDIGFDSFVNDPIFNGGFPLEDRVFGYPNPRVFDTRQRYASANASYRFGDVQLRSITSWQDSRIDENENDSDPFVGFDLIKEDRFNQDVLLTFGGDGDRVRGLLGGTLARVDVVNRLSGFDFDTTGRRDSEALFADVTLGLSDRLSLLAGGRLNHSKVVQRADAFAGLAAIDFIEDRTDFLPKLGVSFDVAPETTIAATARRGFNAGGAGLDFFDFGPYEWQAETVWTYEAAYRQRFGRLLSLGVTAFYSDYKNKQFFVQSDANPNSTRVANLPGSRSYGLEVDARATLSDRLSAVVGIGLLDTRVTRPPEDAPSIDGNEVGVDPDFTGSLSLTWTPLDRLEVGGQLTYVAGYFTDVVNRPDERSGDYSLVDLRASYGFGPFTARVFVNNLFDTFAIYQRLADSGAYVNPPRTIGASLSVALR